MQLYNLVIIILTLLLPMQSIASGQNVAVVNEEDSAFGAVDAEEARDGSVFDKIDTPQNTPHSPDLYGYYGAAKIIAINKITAKSKQITVEVGKSAYFDNVEIKLHKCWKSSDPYIKNNQMLISVMENKFDEDQKLIFQGWLISSEPALSSVEHPVYEVLATDCTGRNIK